MDKATIVGLILGIIFLLMGILSGGTIGTFINAQALFITFGGTLGSAFINFTWEQVLGSGKIAKKAFSYKMQDTQEIIREIVGFSEKARREGLLALEKELENSKDQFLIKGVQMIIDGSDDETIKALLTIEKDYLEERHKVGISFFEQLAAFAPAWGMIGTIVGLILMLKTLNDPSNVGPAMATALMTTFYGALGAFFIFTPIAGKLKVRSTIELSQKEIITTGILAIQVGDNPRTVEEKLVSFLPPKERAKVSKK